MCIRNPARASCGFTLLELILLIVVISVALAGLLLVFSTGAVGSVNPVASKQALATAEAMLEEIQQNAFCNPSGGFSGAATQANRQNFDDVSDYDGFSTTGVYTIDGVSPITGLTNYNVSVTVAISALDAVPAADSRLITVNVTGPTGSPNAVAITLQGYRTDYSGAC